MGGGDKCLLELGGKPLLAHTIARTRGGVDRLILNASGDPQRFSGFGLEVIPDVIPGNAGPLAGVLTGMEWAAENFPNAQWVATFATDAPFIPDDLPQQLKAALIAEGAEIACAASGGRTHPVFALWPVALAPQLRGAMQDEGLRKVGLWIERFKLATVTFETEPFDPFMNINTPDDLCRAARSLDAPPPA